MNKLLLLDAYALIYRAFYGMVNSQRLNTKGFNTSTTFGFVNTLVELLNKEKPTHIAVAFDPIGPTFRHIAYPEYKAQRDKTPENIHESVPIIKRIIKAWNIPIFEVQGFEADDVIGTMAQIAEEKGFQTYMVTPDKDYCQLVSTNTSIYRPGRGNAGPEILGPEGVCEKYGLDNPLQVIDLLGLQGDSADNVPGCPGVGPKTAATLIKNYGSIEGIYEHLAELKGKLRENLEQNRQQVLNSKFLVTIKRDVPLDFDAEKMERRDFNKEELRKIFEELEFNSLIKKLFGKNSSEKTSPAKQNLFESPTPPQNEEPNLFSQIPENQKSTENGFSNGKISPEIPADTTEDAKNGQHLGLEKTYFEYELADTEEKRVEIVAKICAGKKVSINFSTTSLNAFEAEIIGLGFSTQEGKAWYVPVEDKGLFGDNTLQQFKKIFEDGKIEKVGYDLKFAMLLLATHQIELKGKLFDVMLAHYVLQPEQHDALDVLARHYLEETPMTLEETFKAHWRDKHNMALISKEKNMQFTCQQTDFAFRLKPLLEKELEETGVKNLFEDIEMPLVNVLEKMEFHGVRIDQSVLAEISKLFTQRLNEYEQKVFELCGETFNLSSPKQVGVILFDKMQLDPKAKKTRTGQYETSEATLENLRDKSPVIEQILNYREMKKLLSTYVDALPSLVNPRTGHIHASFNQAVTATGRLSSSNPNLQNIPVRGEDGKEIRKAFIPENGCEFFSADYSQIELRIMAHLSNDQHMIEAFRNGLDIHAATAAKVFRKPLEEVTPEERRKAKTANFGIIYGITAFGLSQRMEVSRTDAKELIENYFETFPSIQEYINQIVEIAHKQGYVETLFHRRRYLPEINSQNGGRRNFSERNAVNAPIQGTAADIIKIAMINIDRRFHQEGLRSKMLIQVHDELNFSVPPEEKKQVEEIVKYEMSHACLLQVPLIADCGWGKNWLEAH